MRRRAWHTPPGHAPVRSRSMGSAGSRGACRGPQGAPRSPLRPPRWAPRPRRRLCGDPPPALGGA
eukprot:10308553-Alexandrium_andersonii.AAC.1